jgi:hypothetical protein
VVIGWLFSLARHPTSAKHAAWDKPDATETICTTQTAAKCHTAFMAFHETFWVVTGTAAPVIALAAVVSAGDADEQVDRLAEATVRLSVAFHKDRDDPDLLEVLDKAGTGNLLMIAKLQYVNVVIQAVLLAVSLGSIASQRNLISQGWAGGCAVVGILFLALVGARTIGAKRYSGPMLRGAEEAEQQAARRMTRSSKTRDADENKPDLPPTLRRGRSRAGRNSTHK